MILKHEINTKARKWNVPPDTVDKDWVLGHFLSAFFSVNDHTRSLVFKGGTCLRKCYFPNYRFSEDLDFTALNTAFSLTADVVEAAIIVSSEHSGILFFALPIEELQYKDRRTGDQVKIMFWGANHHKNTPPPADPMRWHHSIKVEVTIYEQVVFPPAQRHIYHEYSDDLMNPEIDIPCYDLRETMAEKIRSLVQRRYTAPRDFYDIWKLHEQFGADQWQDIDRAFHEKMRYKGHIYEGPEQLINDKAIHHAVQSWERSLAHQIPAYDSPDVHKIVHDLRILLTEKLTISNGQ